MSARVVAGTCTSTVTPTATLRVTVTLGVVGATRAFKVDEGQSRSMTISYVDLDMNDA